MEITRYITVQAVQTKDNKLIPIWDKDLVFEHTEMYGNVLSHKDHYKDFFTVVECIYDLKTKTLSEGIIIDIYPDEKDLEFKIGEPVYYEKAMSHRKLTESKIQSVVYEEYDMYIRKGKKLESYHSKHIKDFKKEAIYAMKNWKPFYILEDGTKIEWAHQLYHKA